MGHHDLPGLPRTPGFKRVVAQLGDSAGGGGAVGILPGNLEQIADETLTASDKGLQLAKGDEGLSFCIYLMTQLAQAACEENLISALVDRGVALPTAVLDAETKDTLTPTGEREFTVFDLVSAFSATVDRHLRRTRARTDIGEMAQLAASESISALCASDAETLFGSTEATVRKSLKRLSTRRGFATLTHDFFSRMMRRYLEYHLGRELSNHVGAGRRFANVREHNAFLKDLGNHCHETTSVVRRFAGDWYRKHDFQQDLTLEKTRGFAAHALDKVREAFRYQERRGRE